MKVAIMQPYFMPYIGYFQLINVVDTFVLLDEVQFIRHGWIERNRILDSNKDWQYIKVPLIKHSRNTLIKNISINNKLKWKEKILAQLVCYKNKAPYYKQVIELLETIFKNNYNSITELNYNALTVISNYLEIKTPIHVFSEMNLTLNTIKNSGDWALQITKVMKASTYINPIKGKQLFEREKFINNNLTLEFIEPILTSYEQKRSKFEDGLSIIDVMMFNDKKELKNLLKNFRILK